MDYTYNYSLADFKNVADIRISVPVPTDPFEDNVIWVSPTEVIQKRRNWCVEINDPTNPDGYIEIGRFVAGQASILTELENITHSLSYTEESFKDEMQINGFSSISNNRALKKKLTVSFENINLNAANWAILRRYMRYARDTKKALILPDPTEVYRFNLYAKLKKMPEQKVTYIDNQTVYGSFNLEWDEGR
jgi:hypothetical protein